MIRHKLAKKHQLLWLIIILAIAVRFYQWDEKFFFNAEYSYKLWPMQNMISDRKIPLIGIEAVSFIHHLHYPPFFIYIFAPIVYLAKWNPAVIELVLILLSGLVVWLYYSLGSNLVDESFGLLLALVYAVSFFTTQIDRFIWVVGLAYMTSVGFLAYLAILLKSKKLDFFSGLILGSLLGLGVNFHYQMFIYALALVIISGFANEMRRKLSGQFAYGVLMSVLFFFLPLVIFDLRHNFYNLRGVLVLIEYSQTVVTKPILARAGEGFVIVGNMLESIFNIYNAIDDLFIYKPITLVFLTTLIIAGWKFFRYTYKNTSKRLFSKFLLLLFVIGLVSYSALKQGFSYYLYVLHPVVLVVFTYLLYLGLKTKTWRIVVLMMIMIVLTMNTHRSLTFSQNITYKQQLQQLSQIFNQAKLNNRLKIKFHSISSEELSFLLYYGANKHNFDYSRIEIYEPWQVVADPDVVI